MHRRRGRTHTPPAARSRRQILAAASRLARGGAAAEGAAGTAGTATTPSVESIDLIGASHLSYNTECLAEELYDVGAGGSRGKAYIDADGARAENKSEARWSESPPLV